MRLRSPNEKELALVILVAVTLFSVFAIAIPFSQNSLQGVDMPGHLQAAAYVKNVLWPSPIGWDYTSFAGYPLHQFYAPLFAWLAALLSFALSLEAAFKLLLLLGVLATPLSVYYCARKFSFAPFPSSVLALMVFAVVYSYSGTSLGSDFFSIFVYGFVGMALLTPLLFFYMGRLKQDAERKSYVVPSALLAAISLSHIVVGSAAWIFLFSLMLVRGRERLPYFIRHALLSGLLIAFWAVPLLAKIAYTSPEVGWVNFLTLGLYAMAIFAAVGLSTFYLALRKKDREVEPLIIFFALLVISFVLGMVTRINIPLYRFFIIALAAAFFIMVRALVVAKKVRFLAIPVAIAAFAIFFSIGAINYSGPEPISLPDFGKVDGRIIVTYWGPGWHAVSSLVPPATGNMVARGLYIESTINGHYYRTIESMLRNESPGRYVQGHLDHFGINWLLADSTTKANYTEKRYITSYNGTDVFLFRIANTSLVEVLNYTPRRTENGWKKEANEWFDSGERGIAAVSGENLPAFTGTGKESAELLEYSHQKIRVRVDSEKPVPVFLKFSYFPNWKAYVNGEEARIYQVLPALMIVYGYGNIELRYEETPADIAGWILSALGFIVIVTLSVRHKSLHAILSRLRKIK